jgi:hypothetical protein
MHALIVSFVTLGLVATPALAEVAILAEPGTVAVNGLYKVLRKGKKHGPVRRQIEPGGNLVRAVFAVESCARVADPYAQPWTCTARLRGVFRAGDERGTSEAAVTYSWDPVGRRMTLEASNAGGPAIDPTVGFAAEPTAGLAAWVRTQRECTGSCNIQSFEARIEAAETAPGSRCRAFYQLAATSDASPVRSFGETTRPAYATLFPCR